MSPASAHREHPLKRPLDALLALAILILLSPFLAVVSLLIKIESRGSVLYRQRRWGRQGMPFYVYKFRTMVPASDDSVTPAAEDDPRVTRIGRLLRRTGFDEAPQLVNILRGEMSFVGPRPLAIGETFTTPSGVTSYEALPGFDKRLAARPGLTSPATVYLSRDVEPGRKFDADLEYIDRQSLALDLKLIVLSFMISLRARWETRGRKL